VLLLAWTLSFLYLFKICLAWARKSVANCNF